MICALDIPEFLSNYFINISLLANNPGLCGAFVMPGGLGVNYIMGGSFGNGHWFAHLFCYNRILRKYCRVGLISPGLVLAELGLGFQSL